MIYIGYKKLEDLLKESPHVLYGDLAVVGGEPSDYGSDIQLVAKIAGISFQNDLALTVGYCHLLLGTYALDADGEPNLPRRAARTISAAHKAWAIIEGVINLKGKALIRGTVHLVGVDTPLMGWADFLQYDAKKRVYSRVDAPVPGQPDVQPYKATDEGDEE